MMRENREEGTVSGDELPEELRCLRGDMAYLAGAIEVAAGRRWRGFGKGCGRKGFRTVKIFYWGWPRFRLCRSA